MIRRIDKYTEISGENYMAVILILVTFSNMLINEIFMVVFGRQVLRLGFDPALILAVVLTIGYIMLAELEIKLKRERRE